MFGKKLCETADGEQAFLSRGHHAAQHAKHEREVADEIVRAGHARLDPQTAPDFQIGHTKQHDQPEHQGEQQVLAEVQPALPRGRGGLALGLGFGDFAHERTDEDQMLKSKG